jgi:hypothetical protein
MIEVVDLAGSRLGEPAGYDHAEITLSNNPSSKNRRRGIRLMPDSVPPTVQINYAISNLPGPLRYINV